MPKKKPYFPNNWRAIKDADEECFTSPDGPLIFEDFMAWKCAGWELPSSVACIIRVTDVKTKKVKEHVYQSRSAANRKIKKLMANGHEFYVVDDNNIHHLMEDTTDLL